MHGCRHVYVNLLLFSDMIVLLITTVTLLIPIPIHTPHIMSLIVMTGLMQKTRITQTGEYLFQI